MTDVQQIIEQTIAPLREARAQLEREIDVLQREIVEKREQMKTLDAVLRSAEPKTPREKPKREKPRRRKEKRYPVDGIADERVDEILAAMRRIGEPAGTSRIAEDVPALGSSSVGRALAALADGNVIRRAGVMEGVRGTRPLYALWTNEEVSSNGAKS